MANKLKGTQFSENSIQSKVHDTGSLRLILLVHIHYTLYPIFIVINFGGSEYEITRGSAPLSASIEILIFG